MALVLLRSPRTAALLLCIHLLASASSTGRAAANPSLLFPSAQAAEAELPRLLATYGRAVERGRGVAPAAARLLLARSAAGDVTGALALAPELAAATDPDPEIAWAQVELCRLMSLRGMAGAAAPARRAAQTFRGLRDRSGAAAADLREGEAALRAGQAVAAREALGRAARAEEAWAAVAREALLWMDHRPGEDAAVGEGGDPPLPAALEAEVLIWRLGGGGGPALDGARRRGAALLAGPLPAVSAVLLALEVGRLEVEAGEVEAGRSRLEEALARHAVMSPGGGDGPARVALGEAAWLQGDVDGARVALAAGLDRSAAAGESSAARRAGRLLATVALSTGDVEGIDRWGAAGVGLLLEAGDPPRARALAVERAALTGDPAALDVAYGLFAAAGEAPPLRLSLAAADAARRRGDPAAEAAALTEALPALEALAATAGPGIGHLRLAEARWTLAGARRRAGDAEGALREASAALDAARRARAGALAAEIGRYVVGRWVPEGEAARERLKALLEGARADGLGRLQVVALVGFGQVHREAGRLAAAGAVLEQALDLARATGDSAAEALVSLELARLARALGREDEAQALARRAMTLAPPHALPGLAEEVVGFLGG